MANVVQNIDSRKKSVAKAISWRLMASMVILASVYIFTGEAILSINVTLVDIILKLFLYYFHERAWMRINL